MKQKLLKTMLLLSALIAGSMSVWGESIEINTTNSGVTGSYRDATFDVNDITFGFTQWMKNTNIQAKKSTTNSCYNVDAIPGTITSIVVVQTGTARAITMYGGTSEKPTDAITSPSTAATMTFDFSGKDYNYFSLKTPGNACYFNTITINYTPSGSGGGGGGTTPTTTTITPSITNTDVYTSTAAGSLSASVTVTEGGAAVVGANVAWSSSKTDVATVALDGTVTLVAAGTTTITASYAGDATYAASSDTYELTVTDSNPAIIIAFNNALYGTSFTGTNAAGDGPFNGTQGGVKVTVDQGSSANLYVNDSETRIYDSGSITLEAPTGYVITNVDFTTGNWNVSATPGTLFEKIWSGTAKSVVFSASARSDFKTAAVTLAPGVEVSDAGYTTYVTPEAVEFTSVTAYKVAAVGSTTLSLAIITSAPADTPVIIEADEDVYEFTPTDDPAAVGTNKLKASDGNVVGDGSTIFALGKKNGDVGFYLVKSGVKVPVGKAYIDTTVAGVKEFLTFDFGDNDADGLESVQGVQEVQGPIYNLAGQRISKMQKGINIVNGKKVLF